MLRFIIAFILPIAVFAQAPSYSADEVVPPFKGRFGYGANMGYFPPHYYDKELATIAHGTPDGKVKGFGVTTIRPGLFDHFLDYWGFEIRKDAFQYYKEIGLEDIVVIIGFPSERNRENAFYCPGERSEHFKGLYEPIWDNGENGTPVNDANAYAVYVWNMVNVYKDYVKFWEVWNEPDVDNGNAWKEPGTPGNWWEYPYQPCETKLKAPPYYYVRTLRITYEIVKKLDPEDYVCVGGLGWPSYLDAICRYTDNPFDGTVTAQYPRMGGAYFDCMSFHSYPHIDNSLREWDNSLRGFRYSRHSDRAVEGIWKLKDKFDKVLKNYGYDGVHSPEKVWICTEFNTPRKQYGDYLGSDESQVNFMIKALVTAQMEGLAQMHIYSLADEKPEAQATNEFAYMGMFKNLEGVMPYQNEPTSMAWAYKTTSDLLNGSKYDPVRTQRLNLPSHIKGAAFRDSLGRHTYVLWAVTALDRDEKAEALYSFPQDFGFEFVEVKNWQYSDNKLHQLVNAQQIPLTGSPVFVTPTRLTNNYPKRPKLTPNPTFNGGTVLEFWMFEEGPVTVDLFDMAGRHIQTIMQGEKFIKGPHSRLLDVSNLPYGVYAIWMRTAYSSETVRLVYHR
jgi:hypothetical protein